MSWTELNNEWYDYISNVVIKRFKFNPYAENKISVSTANYKLSTNLIADKIGFDSTNDFVEQLIIDVFTELNKGMIVVYQWQYTAFEVESWENIPRDDFNEWLIAAIPNSDYYFILSDDMTQGCFGNGKDMSIVFFGSDVVTLVKKVIKTSSTNFDQ